MRSSWWLSLLRFAASKVWNWSDFASLLLSGMIFFRNLRRFFFFSSISILSVRTISGSILFFWPLGDSDYLGDGEACVVLNRVDSLFFFLMSANSLIFCFSRCRSCASRVFSDCIASSLSLKKSDLLSILESYLSLMIRFFLISSMDLPALWWWSTSLLKSSRSYLIDSAIFDP